MEEKEFTGKPKVMATETVQTSGHEEIFTLVEKDQVVMIAVADKIASKKMFATVDEAKAYIDSKPWELLINVACICFDLTNKQQNK